MGKHFSTRRVDAGAGVMVVVVMGVSGITGSVSAQDPLPPLLQAPRVFCTTATCQETAPMGLATIDLIDQDGWPEVVVVNSLQTQSVSVLRNTRQWGSGQTGLAPATGSPFSLNGRTGYDVEVADMDGQSGADLVVTTWTEPGQVVILYNNGSGQFGAPVQIAALQSRSVRGLAIADFDLDGKQDIALAAARQDGAVLAPQVEVLWNNGGSFSSVVTPVPNITNAQGADVVAGRLRLPVLPGWGVDLAMCMTGNNGSFLFAMRNTGARTWNADTTAQPGNAGLGLAYGRLRTHTAPAVHHNDLTVTAFFEERAYVYLNSGPATFTQQLPGYDLQDASGNIIYKPWGVAMGRIGNSDTKIDVAISGGDPGPPGGLIIFAGRGNGTLMIPGTIFDVDPGFDPDPRYIQIADMNSDGMNDVVTSNYGSDAVSVLLGLEN